MSFSSNQAKQFAMTTLVAHDHTNYNISRRDRIKDIVCVCVCVNITGMYYNKKYLHVA